VYGLSKPFSKQQASHNNYLTLPATL